MRSHLLLHLAAIAALSATHPSQAQSIRDDSYELLSTTIGANSVAATESFLLVANASGHTYSSPDGATWTRVAVHQTGPTQLVSFNDQIYGIAAGSLFRFDGANWIGLGSSQGSLKVQSGRLFNYAVISGGSLQVTFSSDGATWTTLPAYANFGTNVGNLYDLAATDDRVVVTGHSGRYIVHENGAWTVRNVGAGDRLQTALFHGDRLFLGGIETFYVVASSGAVESTVEVASFNRLLKHGGLILGGGGYNPSSGRLVYSADGVAWTVLNGPAIPSVRSISVRGRSLFFAGSTTNGGVVGRFHYEAPAPRLVASNAGRLKIEISRAPLARYALQESADLAQWTPSSSLPVAAAETITWETEKPADGARFYRLAIE